MIIHTNKYLRTHIKSEIRTHAHKTGSILLMQVSEMGHSLTKKMLVDLLVKKKKKSLQYFHVHIIL